MVSMRAMWEMRAVSPLVLPGKTSIYLQLNSRILVHPTVSFSLFYILQRDLTISGWVTVIRRVWILLKKPLRKPGTLEK